MKTAPKFLSITPWIILVVIVSLCFAMPTNGQSTTDQPKATPPGSAGGDQSTSDEEQRQLFKKLESHLTGAKLIGQFTMDGQRDESPKPEEYHILSAKKMDQGDYWLLTVRIKYGGKDRTVPNLPFEIKWAGRTPVITVDRMLVPGFGTFDARVVIRRDKYAGTWAHDNVGGHLFGRIERLSEAELKQGTKPAGTESESSGK